MFAIFGILVFYFFYVQLSSYLVLFSLARRTSFNTCRADLLITNPFDFCLKNSLSYFLKRFFAKHRTPVFFFQLFKYAIALSFGLYYFCK